MIHWGMVRVREEEKAHPCHREISRLSGMQNPIHNLLSAAVHMHNRQDTAVYCSSSGQMRQKGCSSSGRRKSREERVVHPDNCNCLFHSFAIIFWRYILSETTENTCVNEYCFQVMLIQEQFITEAGGSSSFIASLDCLQSELSWKYWEKILLLEMKI